MTPRRPWLHFERRGGLPPRDDEELTITEDGSFTARRTIGGPVIGSFAGKLPTVAANWLRTAVDAAAGAADVTIPTPHHGATEVLQVGGRTLRIDANAAAPKPWRALLDRLRELVEDDVTESPAAAVRLVADARSARLEQGGDSTLDVDVGSVLVRVIRVADEGGVLGRWNGRPAGSLVDNGERLVPTPRWVTAKPGWNAPLPFDHPLELAPGDMFQVWVDLPIRDGERERAGKLYVPVLQADG